MGKWHGPATHPAAGAGARAAPTRSAAPTGSPLAPSPAQLARVCDGHVLHLPALLLQVGLTEAQVSSPRVVAPGRVTELCRTLAAPAAPCASAPHRLTPARPPAARGGRRRLTFFRAVGPLTVCIVSIVLMNIFKWWVGALRGWAAVPPGYRAAAELACRAACRIHACLSWDSLPSCGRLSLIPHTQVRRLQHAVPQRQAAEAAVHCAGGWVAGSAGCGCLSSRIPPSTAHAPRRIGPCAAHATQVGKIPSGMPAFTAGWWAPLINVGKQMALVSRWAPAGVGRREVEGGSRVRGGLRGSAPARQPKAGRCWAGREGRPAAAPPAGPRGCRGHVPPTRLLPRMHLLPPHPPHTTQAVLICFIDICESISIAKALAQVRRAPGAGDTLGRRGLGGTAGERRGRRPT